VTGSSWLPTPAAVSYGTNQGGAAGRVGKLRPSLETMSRRALWPTPTASLGTKGGRITPRKSREGGTLIEAVSARMFPTPTARDAGRGKGWDGPGRPLSEAIGGPLNPTWVDWLMGFPEGWTDLKPSATPSSPKSPNTSDDSSCPPT
jgi:hypothetical protein